MPLEFKRAQKSQAWLRMGIGGPAGSGKTYTALKLASEMAMKGPIAVLDTQRGQANLYGDQFNFDVLELTDHHPDSFIAALNAAVAAGYMYIIIDSVSHEWIGKNGCLELHDAAVRKQKTQNSYTAWNEITPLHNRFFDALNSTPAHIIGTVRSKTDYVQDRDSNGKTTIRKVGMATIQRDGSDYEFDVLMEMDLEHSGVITKSRDGEVHNLDGKVFPKPGTELAAILSAWLSTGEPMKPTEIKPRQISASERAQLVEKVAAKEMPAAVATKILADHGFAKSTEVTIDKLPSIEKVIAAWQPVKKEQKAEPSNNGNPLDLPEVLAPADPREEILDLIRSLELEGMTTNEAYDVVERKSGVRDVKYIMIGEEHLVIDALNAELSKMKKAATA